MSEDRLVRAVRPGVAVLLGVVLLLIAWLLPAPVSLALLLASSPVAGWMWRDTPVTAALLVTLPALVGGLVSALLDDVALLAMLGATTCWFVWNFLAANVAGGIALRVEARARRHASQP